MDTLQSLPYGELKLTKVRIIKNLALISLAFFLLFTAYDGLSMLQSTMNKKEGIGVISQAVGYISFCTSSLLFPKYVIKKLGCKITLFISILLYLPFIAGNFYPKWYIMIPGAILAGMGASTLWGSQCTYFNESAVRYARLISRKSVKGRRSQELPSALTSMETLSIKDSQCASKEEIFSKSGSPKVDQTETSCKEEVVRYKCKNPDCKNVDEYFVSEIEISCVQYTKSPIVKDIPQINIETKPTNTEEDTSKNVQQQYKNNEQQNVEENVDEEAGHKEIPEADVKISDGNENRKDSSVSKQESARPMQNKRLSICQSVIQRSTTLESVTAVFFGCHGLAYYSAQICSNIISYNVLKADDMADTPYLSGCSCGSTFCSTNPECISDDTDEVSKKMRYLLTSISLIIAFIGALAIIIFLDPLNKAKTEEELKEPVRLSLNLVLATFSHCRKKEQLCLIPISFFEGMLQGFYTADFTKSYVGCAWGASHVGLVSIFYGCACVVASTASGFLVKYGGRKPLFLLGLIINIVMLTFIHVWIPDSSTPYKFYIGAMMFGTITGIFWSQLLSFYGLLFKKDEEAAFASYYLWSSLGWTTSFLYSDHLCMYIKIYIVLIVSLIGTTGYFFTEHSYGLTKKQGRLEAS
ncbi:UNC93-like protein [Caerostris extrusa]|uniref:UNC93-like protein n=1 Tax=Caerostris extrusa TaxID=172846 RepID=A0AAV4WZK0_CAEEX|nr:UNC93-like protein [Caerostris extrusa]